MQKQGTGMANWMLGGLSAIASAGALAIIGGDLISNKLAGLALILLVISVVPMVTGMALKAEPDRYRFGWWTKLLPVLGAFTAGIGLELLVMAVSRAAGIGALIMFLICALTVFRAEDAAKNAKRS